VSEPSWAGLEPGGDLEAFVRGEGHRLSDEVLAERLGQAGADQEAIYGLVDLAHDLRAEAEARRNGSEPGAAATESGQASHSWTPIVGPLPPPAIGGLLYPGRRHVVSGEPDNLKTWAMLVLEVEEIRAGHAVVHVDLEMGRVVMRERLGDLGLSDEEIDRGFVYVEPGEPLTDPAILADVETLLAERQPSLVVFDAFTGALELHGLDPNSGVEVERFFRTVVTPFQRYGAAVALLDHVTKDKDARGRYSIASERKLGGVDVHLGFQLVHPFGRGRTGLAKVTTHKDRLGHLPRPKAAEIEFVSDAETGLISWTIRPGENADDEHPFRPTTLMEKASRFVEAHVAEETPSLSATEAAVKGRRDYVRLAVEILLREDYFSESPGPRNARLLRSLKPYREADDEGSSDGF